MSIMLDQQISEAFVDINDISMYYRETGMGTPLILLHGGLGSSDMWEPCLPFFAEQFRVVTPDSRAHGRTDNPSDTLSYQQMAEDVAALIEALDLDRPFVGGWSDGGQIALELGMRHPDLARGLIIGGAWYSFTDRYLRRMKAMGFEGPGQFNQVAYEKVIGRFGLHPPAHYDNGCHDTQALQLTHLWMTDLAYGPDDFAKVTVPSLIMLGDRDGYIPVEQAVQMYKYLPDAELSISPGVGHDLPEVRAETFAAIVLDFLERHSDPGTS